MGKVKKQEWNNHIYQIFPSKQLKEETRQRNRDIDRHMPCSSKGDNSWRVLTKTHKKEETYVRIR